MEYGHTFGGIVRHFGALSKRDADARKHLDVVRRLEHSILHAVGQDVDTGLKISLVKMASSKGNALWTSTGVCVEDTYVLSVGHGIQHTDNSGGKGIEMALFEYDDGGDYGEGSVCVWPQGSRHRRAEASYAVLDRMADFALVHLPSGLPTFRGDYMPATLRVKGSSVHEGNNIQVVAYNKNGGVAAIYGRVMANDLVTLDEGNKLLSRGNRLIHTSGELLSGLHLEALPVPGQSGSPVFDSNGSLAGLLTDKSLSCGHMLGFNAVANSILGAVNILAFERSRLEGMLGYIK